MSDASEEIRRPDATLFAVNLAKSCVGGYLGESDLQTIKAQFDRISVALQAETCLRAVPDLLDTLDLNDLEAFLKKVIKELPADEHTTPQWETQQHWNVRRNLGVWYTPLLFIGRYVHHYDGTMTDPLTRRMQGIASESLRWLPGAFLAQVAVYSRSANGLSESSYLTALRIPPSPASTPLPAELLDSFNRDFDAYVEENGSTIRRNAQVVRSGARRRSACEPVPLHSKPIIVDEHHRPLLLKPDGASGSKKAYLTKVNVLADRLGFPLSSSERLPLLDYHQIAAGTESGQLYSRETKGVHESSAHLYVVQFKKPGFLGVPASAHEAGASSMPHEYYEAFRECLVRLALENALERVNKEQKLRVQAYDENLDQQRKRAETTEEALKTYMQAIDSELFILRSKLEIPPVEHVASFVTRILSPAHGDGGNPVGPWRLTPSHQWRSKSLAKDGEQLWAYALCSLAQLEYVPDSSPTSLWESRRRDHAGGPPGERRLFESALVRLGFMGASVHDLLKLSHPPTYASNIQYQLFFALHDSVLGALLKWRNAQDRLSDVNPDIEVHSCGELFLAAGLNIESDDVTLCHGITLPRGIDWKAFVNGLNAFASAQERQYGAEHEWSTLRDWRLAIRSLNWTQPEDGFILHWDLELTLLPLRVCPNGVADPTTPAEPYYVRSAAHHELVGHLAGFIRAAARAAGASGTDTSSRALRMMFANLETSFFDAPAAPRLSFLSPATEAGTLRREVAVLELVSEGPMPRVVLRLISGR